MQISPGTPIGQGCRSPSRIQISVLSTGWPIDTPREATTSGRTSQAVEYTVVSVGP